jgi:MerR family copper efflux transcriptional regulator
MKIGDIAKLFGIRTSKVRFLEAQGLVHPARNSSSGYRDYNETAVKQLSFILKAQSFGFKIQELRRFFVEGGGCEFSGDFVIERMTIKLNELRRDIDRTCATRDRLIKGINDVKARVQVKEKSEFNLHLAHPAALMPLARPGNSIRLRRGHARSTGTQQKRKATPGW